MGKKKWNRDHQFRYTRRSKSTDKHPVFVFQKNRRHSRFLIFTTEPHTDGVDNKPLLHNIDEKDSRTSYVRKGYFERESDKLDPVTDKKFRIHKDDLPIVNLYKKKRFKRK